MIKALIKALINAYIQFWKNTFSFRGRTRRKDFWIAYVLYIHTLDFTSFFAQFNLYFVDPFMDPIFILGLFCGFSMMEGGSFHLSPESLSTLPFWIIFMVGLIAICSSVVRRLHDAGFSGWWLPLIILGYVLSFVLQNFKHLLLPHFGDPYYYSFFGSIIKYCIIAVLCQPSQPFTNSYGENPLEKSPLESKTTSSDENSK